jgi:hypothetical protein
MRVLAAVVTRRRIRTFLAVPSVAGVNFSRRSTRRIVRAAAVRLRQRAEEESAGGSVCLKLHSLQRSSRHSLRAQRGCVLPSAGHSFLSRIRLTKDSKAWCARSRANRCSCGWRGVATPPHRATGSSLRSVRGLLTTIRGCRMLCVLVGAVCLLVGLLVGIAVTIVLDMV